MTDPLAALIDECYQRGLDGPEAAAFLRAAGVLGPDGVREALEVLLDAAFVGDDFLTQNGIPMEATPGVRRALRKARAELDRLEATE